MIGLSNTRPPAKTKTSQSEDLAELVSTYKKKRSISTKKQSPSGNSSGINLNSICLPWDCNLDSNIVIKTEKDLQLDSRDFGLSSNSDTLAEPVGQNTPPTEFFQWYKMRNYHVGEKNAVSFSSMMTDSSSYEEQYLGLKIFLAACSASYKRELSGILFPLFLHFYLDLVNKPDTVAAQAFYNKFHNDHEENHKDLLQYLPKITTHSQLVLFPMVHELRKSKIVLKISINVYNYFLQHLRHGNYSLVLQNLNRYFTIRSRNSFNYGQYYDDSRTEGSDDADSTDLNNVQCSSSEQTAIHNLKKSITDLNTCPKMLKPSICLYSVQNAHQGLCCSSFSKKASSLAAGFEDSSIYVWNIVSQGKIGSSLTEDKPSKEVSSQPCNDTTVLRGHHGKVYQVTYFKNDEYMLSASQDKSVRLWNLSTKKDVVTYTGHAYTVWDVCSNDQDTYFVSASLDKTLRLWNTEYACPLRIYAGHNESVDSVAFHPNGNYIASGSSDKTCRLWDIQTGQFVRVFVGHQGPIYSLAFSADGKYLVSGGDDSLIKIWDLSNGQLLNSIKSHTKSIYTLAFSQDGSMLASGGLDGTIKVWESELLFKKKTSSLFKTVVDYIDSYSVDNYLLYDLKFSSGNLLYASCLANR